MKNLTIPFLLSAAAPAFAGVESPVMAPPAPDCTAGFTLGLEALYLRAYQSEGDYENGDFDFGGRGSIGYDFNDCLFIKATYFGYSSSVTDIDDEDGEDTFSQSDDLDVAYFDLVVGQHFKPSEKLTLSPYVGLRWAKFEESSEEHETFFLSPDFDSEAHSDFSGIGVVVGIDGVRTLGSGFSLYGTAKQSIVFGETDHSYDTNGRVVAALDLDHSDEDTDNVLSITELGLGLQYDFAFTGVSANVRLGVEGQWWAGLSDNDSENAGLAGFVLGGNFKF